MQPHPLPAKIGKSYFQQVYSNYEGLPHMRQPLEKNLKVLSIYGLNLDRVGIACRTVDESACHYDIVACFKAEDILCYIEAVVVHNVSRSKLFV